MRRQFILSLAVLALASALVAQSAFASTAIKGYREWKIDKVQAAMTQAATTKSQWLKAKTEGQKQNIESFERQLAQLQWNLDVAKELSVTDYVVLYLSQQSQSDRFQQAANKLSANEVAELMEAFANTLGTATPAETVTKHNTPATTRAHLPVQAVQSHDQVK